ncbi:hypothetical protein N9E56_01490 [Flavobacteriaceae bacterium]|nr:hypothetical protein [Flavobacteriaceae bacterium]
MKENVYIKLLGEGTTVYRPVPAIRIKNNIYKLEGEEIYDPDDEEWEFKPGAIVKTESKFLQSELVLIAMER